MGKLKQSSPFGEVCCEAEKDVLGDDYDKYFFDNAPFNDESVNSLTYLIIGRRGCGKTSLAEYFKFQRQLPNARCIDVDEPAKYAEVAHKVADLMHYSSEISIPKISEVWTYAIWNLIFEQYKNEDSRIKAACISEVESGSTSQLFKSILTGVISKYLVSNGDVITNQLDAMLSNATFKYAKEATLELVKTKPVIVAIDSMEHYSISDNLAMWSIAGLVQSASDFHNKYSDKGIHIKLFLTDEIFPHLKERFIMNTSKHIRDPLFLHWRPKDLEQLVCWRFYKFLSTNKPDSIKFQKINWENYDDIHQKMWLPYFDLEIENRGRIQERTFPYIIRHTQMRPRQLVIICNEIAKRAYKSHCFPKFEPAIIRDAVWHAELQLADEVISSYSRIYPNIGNIVLALSGLPMCFKGSELDRVAKRTAAQWEDGKYSPEKFRQIVAELGIIGRQRGSRDEKTGIVEADFEFLMEDRLFIHEKDDVVIHPMFYRKLNIQCLQKTCVYPFPNHPSFQNLR